MNKRAITLIAAGALVFAMSMPQEAKAGELGNFLRSIKEQGKQALKNQLNTVINGAAGNGYGGTPSYSAPSYGSTPDYSAQPTYAPTQNTAATDYTSSGTFGSAAPLDPSIYETPGTVQASPATSYGSPQPHLTPGPVINGFGSRRASIH